MKIGLNLEDRGATAPLARMADAAEDLGLDSIWLGEAYGSDAVSALGFLAARTSSVALGSAVMVMSGRTPATTAMTAMTLDALSGGRFKLGLGVSGPQVVEGWHGVRYAAPLQRTREYVEVVRSMIARQQPVTYAGEHIRLPYDGPGATGLGKALRTTVNPVRTEIPMLLAALGPKNAELVGEIADGWLPIFYSPERERVMLDPVDAGLASAGRSIDDLEVVASPMLVVGHDLDACRDAVRPMLALYVGGMGARGKNFYFDLACRYGFESAAIEIQDHYLAGRKQEACASVPESLIDETALVGSIERIADRLGAWRESRVTTLCLRTTDPHVLERLVEATR